MEKVLILGSGPAGLTAAIYAARAQLEPLVYEGVQPGGQLTTTTEVENYPGFAEGIDGTELIMIMRKQAERFGARFKMGRAMSAELSAAPFKISFADAMDFSETPEVIEEVETQTLIVATGATAKYLGLPNEQALLNKGVSACAVCDGALPIFRDQELAVVGGGDTAAEEASYLTKFASKVYVIHRRDQLRASKVMAERLLANPKVEMVWDSVVTDVLDIEQGRVTGVALRNVKTDEERLLPVAGMFLGIGHSPNTDFLGGKVDLDEQGFIKVRHPSTETNIPGVFACGDVMDPRYKQAVTAAGIGCAAALDAERYLEALHG
jgi:thioredoxin reductase (NADPH)